VIGIGAVLLLVLCAAVIWVAKVSEAPAKRNSGLLGQN
jgi:hypothetical protein